MKSREFSRRVARVVRPGLDLFLQLFFEKQHLRGRHFDQGLGGYLWALRAIWCRNILRLATPRPWPVALGFTISNPLNVTFHPDDLNNFQSPGVYMQNFDAHIIIGRGTYIAPNVGIITANHRPGELEAHEKGKDVVIGDSCWIGMNAVILPGVHLGPGTIVAAGAIVSKSYPLGRVVLAGVPAKVLKVLS